MDNAIAIAAFYTGINALILLVLAFNVGSRRRKQNALEPGATGDALLTRAIRAHSNYAEHAPLILLLLWAMALLGLSATWLHSFGAAFTLGRILHAIGMMRQNHPNAIRFIGNLSTGLCLLIGGIICIIPLVTAL